MFMSLSASAPLASHIRFSRPPWDSSQPGHCSSWRDKTAPCGCIQRRAAASLIVSCQFLYTIQYIGWLGSVVVSGDQQIASLTPGCALLG